jgi:hypothetical protein
MPRSSLLTLAGALVAALALVGFTLVISDGDPTPAGDPPSVAFSLDHLHELNPAVAAHYGQVSPCVPHMGVHYAPVVDGRPAAAPSVVLAVDPVNGQVTAMEILVPSDMPWQPWFDQPEGEPLELAPGMSFWTQHVYLVDHSEINECPPVE